MRYTVKFENDGKSKEFVNRSLSQLQKLCSKFHGNTVTVVEYGDSNQIFRFAEYKLTKSGDSFAVCRNYGNDNTQLLATGNYDSVTFHNMSTITLELIASIVAGYINRSKEDLL